MRLRSQTQAALRAMLDLTLHSAYHAPVPVSDIAKRQDLGTAFLEQLFRPLKRAGLVAPWRGMKGGYTLARPAEEISLLSVLAALDDPVARPHASTGVQASAEAQAVAALMVQAEAGLEAALGQITLADLKRHAQQSPLLKDAPRAGAGFQI
ncbi:MAG TPA: Rrf2 family transcriptional regulator [bacterium]|jgi:Rrf2 family protein|nr:Rrf2 family transcriptional regulator [bacterium]